MKRRDFTAHATAILAMAFPSRADSARARATDPFGKFLEAFPPDGPAKPFSGTLSADLRNNVPPLLVSFWQAVGFGSFRDGFLHFFHPEEYAEALSQWLNAETVRPDRVPIARTAFGDLVYFRDLRDKAASLALPSATLAEASDISFLSVHHRQSEVFSYDVQSFFDEDLDRYLTSAMLPMLALYRKLRTARPRPSADACYFFEPALVMGGKADAAHIGSGDCLVHLEILHELAE